MYLLPCSCWAGFMCSDGWGSSRWTYFHWSISGKAEMLCGDGLLWGTQTGFHCTCYLSDLLPAYLPCRRPDDRGVLACKVGAVQLPGGQKISRDCYLQTDHKEGAPWSATPWQSTSVVLPRCYIVLETPYLHLAGQTVSAATLSHLPATPGLWFVDGSGMLFKPIFWPIETLPEWLHFFS